MVVLGWLTLHDSLGAAATEQRACDQRAIAIAIAIAIAVAAAAGAVEAQMK